MDKKLSPIVSVVMPVYNCISYIEASVESVLSQTFKNFEFIIIDDFSTDGTYEYLKSLNDIRIHLIRKPVNTGYTISLNMGIQLAQGKYIARMDGDDICILERFEKQVAFMDSNPDVVLCGGSYQIIDSTSKFIPKTNHDDLVQELMISCPFAHPTIFLRNEVLKKNNIKYFPDYEPAEDYKMWTTLVEFGKFANLPDVLIYYRVHSGQTTNQKNKAQREITKKISYEFIKKISYNDHIDYFFSYKFKSIEDVKKYNIVEEQIKSNLINKNIRLNYELFFERKKNYFRQSFYHKTYSPIILIRDLKFFFQFRSYFSSEYVFKHFIKSLLFWKSPFLN